MDPFRKEFDAREALAALACPFDIGPSASLDGFEAELAENAPDIIRALMRIDEADFAAVSTRTRLDAISRRARLKRLAEICKDGASPTVPKPVRKIKRKVKQINTSEGQRAFLCASGSLADCFEKWMRDKSRVSVKLRGHCSSNGANVANRLLEGVIIAFDKHWNLMLVDVDEVYTPAIRLKKVQASANAMPSGLVYSATALGNHFLMQRHLPCSLVTGSSIICVHKLPE